MAKKRNTKPTTRKRSGPDWAPRFLEHLSRVGVISHAAELAGCSRDGVYTRRDADPEFAAAMHQALEHHTQLLEQEAIRRAVEGVERPVFHQGQQCGTIREYSDTLLIFKLKARRPEVYRDNVQHIHTGQLHHTHRAEDLSDEELARIIASGSGSSS